MKQISRKTLAIAISLGLIWATPGLAQPAASNSSGSVTQTEASREQILAELKLEYLIREDFRRFEQQIQSEALSLPVESRYRLYLGQRLENTYPASFLNAFPGIGVGSFSMGDSNGGWALLGGELAGAALAILGAAISGGSASSASLFTGWGTLVIAGFRIYGIFRPLEYAGEYNTRLQRALDLRPSLSASSAPALLDAAEPGLRMSWQF